jgi:hypothetical protein
MRRVLLGVALLVRGSTALNVPPVIYVENGDRYTPYSLDGGP